MVVAIAVAVMTMMVMLVVSGGGLLKSISPFIDSGLYSKCAMSIHGSLATCIENNDCSYIFYEKILRHTIVATATATNTNRRPPN